MAFAINEEWEVEAMAAMRIQGWAERRARILRARLGAFQVARIIRAMHGLHLTADLRGCPVERAVMSDPAALRSCCLGAVLGAGLQPVGELFHRFERAPQAGADAPQGITGVVLLAESHLAVHTWPETAAVTIDVYVCNFGRDNSLRAHAVMDRLLDAFAPTQVEHHTVTRGAPSHPVGMQSA